MEIALIVLSYNHPRHTAAAVRSGVDLGCADILLVHNGSQPAHVRKLRQEFPGIRHIVLEHNRGYAGGVNAGLAAAFESSEWAILLTNDSRLESLPSAPANPAIVAPLVMRRSAARVDSIGALFVPGSARLVHCKRPEEFHGATSARVRRYVPGTAFLVHREVFRQSHGLDERLCIYWDDVDWSARIAALGFPLIADPAWRVMHKVGKTAHSNPLYTLYYFQRNRRLVSWRHARSTERALLPFVLARDFLRISARLIRSGRLRDLRYLPGIALHRASHRERPAAVSPAA